MSYLVFQPEAQDPKKRTATWKVLNTSGTWLGRISWHAPWRKYCYQPAGPQIMDAECLGEIVKFLEGVMREHKMAMEAKKRDEGKEGK